MPAGSRARPANRLRPPDRAEMAPPDPAVAAPGSAAACPDAPAPHAPGRVAEIDRAGFAACECLRTVERCAEAAELRKRQAAFTGAFKQARDVAMRSDLDARGRVILADIGEQEQHQQRAAARSEVDPPVHEIALLVRARTGRRKGDIDMPADIAGIIRMRK